MGNVNLKQGSSGTEVEKLQNALIEKGYDVGSTGADGVFGSNTLAAVKQYQQDNGLTVDGIAGKNTLGALYSTVGNNKPANEPVAPVVPTAPTEGTGAGKPILYGNLTEENSATAKDNISQSWEDLQQVGSSIPGAYDWGSDSDYGMANDYLGQYQNRDPFSYDFNADALYNQYKDQYIQQGQMAMMDTMGQAAAMTGGYGNSYAQTVGQQAYNMYLGKLNEVMPELYGMAYDRYQQEGQDMLNMYDIYMGRAKDNYGRHMDTVDLWKNDYAVKKDTYDTLVNEYIGAYDQKYTEDENERKWDYQAEQDAKADKQTNYNKLAGLISSSGYTPSAEELEAAGMSTGEANAMKKAYDNQMNSLNKTEETKDPTYKDLDIDAAEKKFARLEKIEDVNYWANLYKSEGYSPESIKILAQAARDRILGTIKQNTPPTSTNNITSYGIYAVNPALIG